LKLGNFYVNTEVRGEKRSMAKTVIPLSTVTIADLKKLREQGTLAIIDGDKKVLVIETDGREKGGTQSEDPPSLCRLPSPEN